MSIVDFHFHVTRGEDYLCSVKKELRALLGWEEPAGRAQEALTSQGMTRLLEESGVDFAVAVAEIGYASTVLPSNEDVAEFCKGVPRLIPFCHVNPFLVSHPGRALEHYVNDLGFRGVKLHPCFNLYYPNDSLIYPLYARAEEMGVPVIVHTGFSTLSGARLKYGDPLCLDDVMVDFPRLKLVQAHGGRGFWYDRALFLTRLHDNLYIDISGIPPQRLLSYYPDLEKSADKVVFGSDWPGPNIKATMQAIRALPISEDAKAKILGGNAARILNLKV